MPHLQLHGLGFYITLTLMKFCILLEDMFFQQEQFSFNRRLGD